PPSSESPVPWLLVTLLVSLGAPFFVVSATAPLLQKWFSFTSHSDARDPYFLYAASNTGSLAALISYPLLIEPNLRLSTQSLLWTGGYALLLVLVALCASAAWSSVVAPGDHPRSEGQGDETPDRPAIRTRLRWVALAAAPSSLMLSATNHLTSDISPIPLLWIVPLTLYMASFVLVFTKRPPVPHWLMVRALPIVLLPLVILIVFQRTEPLGLVISFHLVALFVVAMVCHGELARTRPPALHLTEFYLWMSVGGAIGGLCTAIVAPLVFRTLLEYRVALVLACLLPPRLPGGREGHGGGEHAGRAGPQ